MTPEEKEADAQAACIGVLTVIGIVLFLFVSLFYVLFIRPEREAQSRLEYARTFQSTCVDGGGPQPDCVGGFYP